jgi:hypothetical protein
MWLVDFSCIKESILRNDEQSLCLWVASLLWVRTVRGVAGGWVRVGRDWPLTRNLAKRGTPSPSPREKVNPYATIGFTSTTSPQPGFFTDCCGFGQPCTHLKQQHGPYQFLFGPSKSRKLFKANNCSKVPTTKKFRPQKVILTFSEPKFWPNFYVSAFLL